MKPDADAPQEPEQTDESRADPEPTIEPDTQPPLESADDDRAQAPGEESPAPLPDAEAADDQVIEKTGPDLPPEPPMPTEPDTQAPLEPADDDRAQAPGGEAPAPLPDAEAAGDQVIEETGPDLPPEPPLPADHTQETTREIPATLQERPPSGASRRRARLRAATPLLLAGLIGGGVAAGITVGVDAANGDGTTTTIVREAAPRATELTALDSQARATETGGTEALSVQEVYELASPAVVQITTSIDGDDTDPFDQGPRGGLGSGFVIDKEGHIVTNFHVIDGADSIRVVFSDGEGVPAEVVGSDPSTDLAVLRVEIAGRALTPLRLGDSDEVEVGEPAIAIGNPFGLDRTVTTGIVSALQRQIRAPDTFRIEGVIQTDAAINSGNSGGPLLNEFGEVIGVNSQIISGGGAGNVGIGFAVPVNTVKDVVTQLLETGEVAHAFLGVTVQSLTEELLETVRLPVDDGGLVADVRPDTPAADAGLRGGDRDVIIDGQTFAVGGDIITKVDGEPVSEASDIVTAVSNKKPGDPLELEITRNDGSTETVTIELGRRPPPTG